MDEVDGMSAGDRGGAAEMAKLIKKSKVRISLKNILLWFQSLTCSNSHLDPCHLYL